MQDSPWQQVDEERPIESSGMLICADADRDEERAGAEK